MTVQIQQHAAENLQRLVKQIERLEEEKKGLAEDISDKYAEAKALGFDAKILRQVIRLRKFSKAEREEAQMVLDTYLQALDGTPLGDWARQNEERHHAI